MTRIAWDLPGTRSFEAGLDRGVLYPEEGPGVPWVGLTAVDDRDEGGDFESYYLDGQKYLTVSQTTDFAATITSLANPIEFEKCIGYYDTGNSVFVTNQRNKSFGFSYRTLTGNDMDEVDGYKLHIVYNATARRGNVGYATRTVNVDPLEKTYEIETIPHRIPGRRPTSHLVIDSRTTNLFTLGYLESILYGTKDAEPRLPEPKEIFNLFGLELPEVDFPINILGEGGSNKRVIENLFTNPSFETGAGEVTVYENLFTNPSFEAGSGTVEVRRNLALNPLADPSGASSFRSNNAFLWPVTLETVSSTSHPQGITSRAKSVLASGETSPLIMSLYNLDGLMSAAPARQIGAWLYVTGSGYEAWIGNTGNSNLAVPLTAHEWTWITGSGAAGTHAGAYITKISGNASTADTSYITGATVLADTVPEATIAGGISYPDSDLTTSWTGTPNASESVLRGVNIVRHAGTSGDGFQSTQWAESGAKSLRMAYSAARPWWQKDPYNLTLLGAGKTYTVLATVRVDILGTVPSDGPYLSVLDNKGTVKRSDPITSTGVHQIRYVVTIPPASTWAVLRFYGSPGGDVSWDDVAVIEGNYTGPWFDGDNPLDDEDLTTSWTGTPNASTSKVTGVSLAGVTAVGCAAIRSTQWKKTGDYSVRLISKGASAERIQFQIAAEALGGGTLIATRYQEGSVGNGTGTLLRVDLPTQTIPTLDVTGEQEYRLTYSALAGARTAYLYHLGYAGTSVWYDCVGLFEGEYTGPWFGPGQPVYYERQELNPEWTGAEGNSSSIITVNSFLNKTGIPGDTYIIDNQYWTYHPDGYWFLLWDSSIKPEPYVVDTTISSVTLAWDMKPLADGYQIMQGSTIQDVYKSTQVTAHNVLSGTTSTASVRGYTDEEVSEWVPVTFTTKHFGMTPTHANLVRTGTATTGYTYTATSAVPYGNGLVGEGNWSLPPDTPGEVRVKINSLTAGALYLSLSVYNTAGVSQTINDLHMTAFPINGTNKYSSGSIPATSPTYSTAVCKAGDIIRIRRDEDNTLSASVSQNNGSTWETFFQVTDDDRRDIKNARLYPIVSFTGFVGSFTAVQILQGTQTSWGMGSPPATGGGGPTT